MINKMSYKIPGRSIPGADGQEDQKRFKDELKVKNSFGECKLYFGVCIFGKLYLQYSLKCSWLINSSKIKIPAANSRYLLNFFFYPHLVITILSVKYPYRQPNATV